MGGKPEPSSKTLVRTEEKKSSRRLEITVSRIPRKGGIESNSNQMIGSPILVQLKRRKAGC